MLSVQFQLADLNPDFPVEVHERRGSVTYRLSNSLFLPAGVAALNCAANGVLAGGQWFQLWKGEIVSVHSPATPGGYCARIHRGPLVDKAS